MSKLKAWAVNYGGITQVTAAETKSRARYLSAMAVQDAGWVDTTREALLKLRSWRVPEYDAAAQALGHEGPVPCPEDMPVPRDQGLRDELALTQKRLADLESARVALWYEARGARERAERWKTRAVNWMKTSRHCAEAAKRATMWEAKWSKLKRSAMECALFFLELGEKSDKRHALELAEAKAALAKAHAAERIAVEEHKKVCTELEVATKRLAAAETTLVQITTRLHEVANERDDLKVEIGKLHGEMGSQTLETDALRDRIRKMRTALLDQARYWDLILTHVSTATERAEAARCARETAGKEVDEW